MSVCPRAGPVLVALALLALTSAGLAQSVRSTATKSTAPRASANKALPQSVKFIDAPSSESAAAREKRLRRECRGRPNAGACLGLTR